MESDTPTQPPNSILHTQPMQVTILGCGTSGGVPQVDNGWLKCDPNNPKNRRSRCSAYITTTNDNGDDVAFLIDTSPDLRHQLLTHNITHADAILYTHPHADHIGGIDEIRWLNIAMGQGVNAYMNTITHEHLNQRFSYCLGDVVPRDDGSKYYYKPAIYPHVIPYNQQVTIAGVPMTTLYMNHNRIDCMGWRIGNFAYCTDVLEFSDESFALLQGLDYWVVDCLRERPHSTHAHLDRVLNWINVLKPKQTYLTHMNNELDYDHAMAITPHNVAPAHDGLIINT